MSTHESITQLCHALNDLTESESELLNSRPFKTLCMFLDWANNQNTMRDNLVNDRIKELSDKVRENYTTLYRD